jgi:hypothetical protein
MCYAKGVAQELRIPFGHGDNYNVVFVLTITSLLCHFLTRVLREILFPFNITNNHDQQQRFLLVFVFFLNTSEKIA